MTDARFRGSVDILPKKEGFEDVKDLARRVAERGGFDVIYHDNQWRTFLTALVFSALIPRAKIINLGMFGQSQALGELEGQEVNAETIAKVQFFIENPNEVPPGMSRFSTRPGETFNAYRDRWLEVATDLADEASVGKRVACITHNRNIHMMDCLDERGELLLERMNAPGPAPNTIHYLDGWRTVPWDGAWIKPGVYFIRHAETAWN